MSTQTPLKAEALVLVPGLMCDAAAWRAPLDHFTPRLPVFIENCGERDSLPAMAAHLLQHAPPRFALAGHSMGGRVALEVMRQAPQRVTHLALLDTGYMPIAQGQAGDDERAARQRFVDLARSEGVVAMAREWVKGMVHPERLTDTALIEDIVAMFSRRSVAVFEAQIRALLSRPYAFAVLPTIHVPTLVLCGDHDLNSPPAANEELASHIHGAINVVVERCGHMSMQEQPAAVNAALAKCLSL